jgi:hypothetical protein
MKWKKVEGKWREVERKWRESGKKVETQWIRKGQKVEGKWKGEWRKSGKKVEKSGNYTFTSSREINSACATGGYSEALYQWQLWLVKASGN